MIRILVLGDSIAYGGWDTQGGWVERLKRQAHKITADSVGKTKIQIMNLGIGGDNSTKILARIHNEVQARFSQTWDMKIILSFGVNDERAKDGVIEVPIEKYKLNIKSIIEEAKKFTNDILIVGNPPLGKNSVSFKVFEYSDDRLRNYDEVLKNTADEMGIKFLPIRPIFESAGLNGLFVYDDIHVSDSGHELIEREVKPFVLMPYTPLDN